MVIKFQPVFALSLLVLITGLVHADTLDSCHPFCAQPVWKAEEIGCFDFGYPYWEGAKAVPIRSTGAEITEPRLKTGPRISSEMFEELETLPYASEMRLLIDKGGKVEMIVDQRFNSGRWGEEDDQTAAKIQARMVEAYQQWECDPATFDGSPICVWYTVVALVSDNGATKELRMYLHPEQREEQ